VVLALSRRSGRRKKTIAVSAAAALCVVGVAPAVPAFAAGSGPATNGSSSAHTTAAVGGTQFYDQPVISGMYCRAGCSRAGGAARSGRAVTVREKGILRIRGRHLRDVARVVFLGARGRRDDVAVAPAAAGYRTLDVVVPASAGSGRVALRNPQGRGSQPSRTAVRVVHDPDAASAQGLIWPVRGIITAPFGENRGDHMHSGIDIATAAGTPIRAAASGTVSLLGPQGAYGNFTCIRHATFTTCYAHQSEFLTTYGAYVRQGQVIGRVGCTGRCSGPHVHFEVRTGTAPWSPPVDPMRYLPRR
jgi:murein DD-endopeptidase MepM/ murein hydrolase activator NlpD